MEKEEAQERHTYRCTKCGYIVTVKGEEKAPEYCPNCAVTHLYGKMEPLGR